MPVRGREEEMMNLTQYDYYLVLDLEATCCNRETLKRRETEIIEIGAVMVAAQGLTGIDEFQTFIKPVRHPILTEFCKSLTSITQEQVDQAPSYVEAVTLLKQWRPIIPMRCLVPGVITRCFADTARVATSSNKTASFTTFPSPLPILTSISNSCSVKFKVYPSDMAWQKPCNWQE